MQKFEYTQEVLVSVWQRMEFTIEAESKEEADKIAAQYGNTDVSNDYEVTLEYLAETEELVRPSEDHPVTIEVFDCNEFKIADNNIKED